MKRPALTLVLAVALGTAACEKHEFEPPDREERVAAADTVYSEALFDTISWESAEVRERSGNGVYAAECRRCHGTAGRGDTEYARERGLDVPSLVRQDWPYQSLDQVRRRVFTGHPAGMPTFGITRLAPREVDAVASYIRDVLRPEFAP